MENAEMSLVLHDSENGCLATLAADVETYRQGGGKRLKTIELTGEIPVMHRMVKEICFDLSDGDRIRELIFRRSLLERFPCVGRLTVLREAGGFFSADGVLMARERMDDGAEMVALVRYPAAREHRSYTVPPCVQKIERGAFSRLLYLRELVLPRSFRRYEDRVWKGTPLQVRMEDTELAERVAITGPWMYGRCGEHAFWELSEDGVLEVQGEGPLWDDPHLFSGLERKIETVSIREGITQAEPLRRAFPLADVLELPVSFADKAAFADTRLLYRTKELLYREDGILNRSRDGAGGLGEDEKETLKAFGQMVNRHLRQDAVQTQEVCVALDLCQSFAQFEDLRLFATELFGDIVSGIPF
ncbi:MAG: hypothetical protein IK095_01360 [Oscillospiraceae bacterium]|nr:hypothetical protein [Oscillospiraceae bacterium]